MNPHGYPISASSFEKHLWAIKFMKLKKLAEGRSKDQAAPWWKRWIG